MVILWGFLNLLSVGVNLCEYLTPIKFLYPPPKKRTSSRLSCTVRDLLNTVWKKHLWPRLVAGEGETFCQNICVGTGGMVSDASTVSDIRSFIPWILFSYIKECKCTVRVICKCLYNARKVLGWAAGSGITRGRQRLEEGVCFGLGYEVDLQSPLSFRQPWLLLKGCFVKTPPPPPILLILLFLWGRYPENCYVGKEWKTSKFVFDNSGFPNLPMFRPSIESLLYSQIQPPSAN